MFHLACNVRSGTPPKATDPICIDVRRAFVTVDHRQRHADVRQLPHVGEERELGDGGERGWNMDEPGVGVGEDVHEAVLVLGEARNGRHGDLQ